jgi:DNA-binding GntR family transcriptional regulator
MKRKPSKLTPGEGVTRYRALYDVLSKSLKSKRRESLLPSEPELSARYRVSRTTVRRAFAMLEREGRIQRVRGSGTYTA